jgi:hypothetical protein
MRSVTKLPLQALIFLCYIVATVCLAILTCIGYALTWLYKRAGWPDDLKAWNCWSFVIAKWLEAGPRKVYLVVRLSPHGPIPHVMYAKSISGLFVAELKPLRPKRGWRAIFDSVKFKGRVREGEGEEKK